MHLSHLVYLFICHGHLSCFCLFWLLWIMLLWTWVYKYFFENLLSVILGVYPEVELLDHILILFLVFWGTTTLFSTAAAALYLPTNSTQGFQFLHILINTIFYFFIMAILIGVKSAFLLSWFTSVEKCFAVQIPNPFCAFFLHSL